MTIRKTSRRNFIKVIGLGLAATTLTCSGIGYVATRAPDVETPTFTFGEENTTGYHILVTYATRAGSTAEIATAIGESLSQRGFVVDVRPVKDNPDLAGYQAVLMGSSVRMGNWLPEAITFIENNQSALVQTFIALFTVHLQNVDDDETSRAARLAYLNVIRPLLNGAEEVYFAGVMDFSRLSLLDRSISKMVGGVEADNRDWDKIRSWVPAALAQK
ncbi:MAG: flavodoxin domain-containing protein [Anaerolineae bacterium]|nr:flavodoxin domain-containing protein [Anaerolineae bacterium]